MENATDALKIAFAAMIFVMALSIAIAMFSQLNDVSKVVLSSSDVTSFYEYEQTTNQKNRIVGLEAIIPTIYKYYKENFTILFLDRSGNPLPLYRTKTDKASWGGGVDEHGVNPNEGLIGKYYSNNSDDNPVCTFDVDEETIRHEPWTGSPTDYKANIDAFLYGKIFNYPDGSGQYYDYKAELLNAEGFIGKYSGKQFYEMIGEYTYNIGTDAEQKTNELLKNKKKRVIVYQLVS